MIGVGFFHGEEGLDPVYEVVGRLAKAGATVSHPEMDFSLSDELVASSASDFFADWTGDGPLAVVGFGRGAIAAQAAADSDPRVFLAVLVGGDSVDRTTLPEHIHWEIVDSNADNELIANLSTRQTIPAFILEYLRRMPWPKGWSQAQVAADSEKSWIVEVDCGVGQLILSATAGTSGEHLATADFAPRSGSGLQQVHLQHQSSSMSSALLILSHALMGILNFWGPDPRKANISDLPSALQTSWQQITI